MSGHNIFYIWDFFHIQGAALVKPAIDLSNKVSCYTSDIRRQRSRIVSSIWDVFHLLSAALVKPGLSLIFYLKFLPSLQGFIRKSSNGSNPANTTFTRCFCIFDLAPLKRCLLHKLPLSCIDSELLLQRPELTMNRRLTFPWVFLQFFRGLE